MAATIADFEPHRAHLHAVAHRMLGSAHAAEDAVQEAWIRFAAADTDAVENTRGWLTTVVSRVCLNALRARRTRRESYSGSSVPDPVVVRYPVDGTRHDPEHETVLNDAVAAALLVVLDRLTPSERVAFVLHDVFAVPFDEIATMLDRTPAATRQLASRARRRVRSAPHPDTDRQDGHRRVVAAFFDAARRGDLDRLVELLDDDVVLRADGGVARRAITEEVRGSSAIAQRAIMFASPTAAVHPALVNDHAGAVIVVDGRTVSVMEFVIGDRITRIVALADPDRLDTLDVRDVVTR